MPGRRPTTGDRHEHTNERTVQSAFARTTPERVLRDFLAAWKHGNIVEAAALFGDPFAFVDHALELEFRDKRRLIEFLQKTCEFFPDTDRTDETIFHGDDYIISEWTLTATQLEPYFGGLVRQMRIRVQG